MKLHRLALVIAIPLLVVGCEDEGAPEEGGAEEAAAPKDGEAAPAEGAAPADGAAPAEGAAAAGEAADPAAAVKTACEAVMTAIKAKDVDALVAASNEGAAEVITADSIAGIAAGVGEATCGEAKVDGENATVTAGEGDAAREIPFVMADGAWKFNAAAYAEKYPAKGKKGKKGEKMAKKEKGKKGKKGGKKKKDG